MEEVAPMTLAPNPESMVALMKRIVTLGWPGRADDQCAYFRQLGFQRREGQLGFRKGCGYFPGSDPEAVLEGDLSNDDLAVTGASWLSYKGELFSINFFAYDFRDVHDRRAVIGYRSIHAQLLSLYGQPTDSTVHPLDEASCEWQVNGTSIQMYCHTRPLPVLQIGFSHIPRNTAYEERLTK